MVTEGKESSPLAVTQSLAGASPVGHPKTGTGGDSAPLDSDSRAAQCKSGVPDQYYADVLELAYSLV